MEAQNQAKKVPKASTLSATNSYSYSYTGDYYSGSQNGSYTDGSYSYSYSPQGSRDGKGKGGGASSVLTGMEYSYSVSDPKQDLKRTPKPTTYDYTGESTSYDEYSYSSLQQSVHKSTESPSQQVKKFSPQKEDEEEGSYSYSYSYSYSDYTSSLSGKQSSIHKNGSGHGGPDILVFESADSSKIATSGLGSSIVKVSRPNLSGSSSSSSSSTGSSSYSYSYSYSVESLTPTHDKPVDIQANQKHDDHSPSAIHKTTPLDSYTYGSNSTESSSYTYSYSYSTSTESSGSKGRAHTQSDDYSHSATTPYAAHTNKVVSHGSYTNAQSYSSSGYRESCQTASSASELTSGQAKPTIPSLPLPVSSSSSSYYYYEVTSGVGSTSATQTARFQQRTLTVVPPPLAAGRGPPLVAPSRCFVRVGSQEDSAARLLQALIGVQQRVEARVGPNEASPATQEGPAASSTAPPAKADPAKTSKPSKVEQKEEAGSKKTKGDAAQALFRQPVDLLTPKGYCSQKTVRVALGVLQLNHLERREVLRHVSMPMEERALLDILDTCAATRVRDTVAKTFLAHDPSRAGELPLSVVGEALQRLGVARSPVIDDAFRVNICPVNTAGTEELFVAIETSQHVGHAANMRQWQSQSIPVCRIVHDNLAAKRPTSISFQAGSIYMGQSHICHGVPSEACFQRLKTYLKAATYVCVLTHFFSYEDDITREVKVQYPELLRRLLTPSEIKGKKSIYLENLFRELYHIDQRVKEFADGHGVLTQYSRKDLIESTLYGTKNVEEKRRRNVIPNTSEDLLEFQKAPEGTDEKIAVSLCLQKVRIPVSLPSDAHCYCLVSAITHDDVFLPAVEVPVRKVHTSTKEGFTWVFDKKEKSEILFVGPCTDRLYVECCYELKQEQLSEGLSTKEDPVVWCAGYSVLPVAHLREKITWPVVEGSLLAPLEREHTPTPFNAENSTTVPPPRQAGFFACIGLGGRGGLKKMIAAQPAVEIKVKTLKQETKALPSTPPYEDMPARYIVFSRHAKLTRLLRASIHRIGKLCRHAPQTLRQQVTQRILLVASDTTLMDQLSELWDYKLKQMDSAKKKDAMYQHDQLLLCVSTLAALHNCSSEDQGSFAALAIRRKPLLHAFDVNAPQRSISV